MSDFPPKAHEQARRIAALMRRHRQRFEDEVSKWDEEASRQDHEKIEAYELAVILELERTVKNRCRDEEGGNPDDEWEPYVQVIAEGGPAYRKLLSDHSAHSAVTPIPYPPIALPIDLTDRPLTFQEKIVVLAAIHAAVVEKESATEREDCHGALIREVFLQRGDEFWIKAAMWVDDVAAVATEWVKCEPPSDETQEPLEPPEDEDATRARELWADVRTWVDIELKGKQQRLMELLLEDTAALLENRAVVKLVDIASDPMIDWDSPYDDSFSSIARVLKGKLMKAKKPVTIVRRKNVVKLTLKSMSPSDGPVKNPSKTRQK
jgi:hypothetical protein